MGVQERVVGRLQEAGGIDVRLDGDALVLRVGKGRPLSLRLEVRHRFDPAEVTESPPLRRNRVLVVPSVPARRRDDLRALGISWIEYATGVVHLRAPGLAIELPAVAVPLAQSVEGPKLSGKAGVVVEAIIELYRTEGRIEQAGVAALAGVTQAWTSKVFTKLVREGAMEVFGAGPMKRWRPNLERVFELWGQEERPGSAATGLFVWTRGPLQLLKRLEALSRLQYAVGGAAAADLYRPTLTAPEKPLVWIPTSVSPRQAAGLLEAELTDDGANMFLRQDVSDAPLRLARRLGYWRGEASKLQDISVVSPARAAIEALQSAGRGPEVAENLRSAIVEEAKMVARDTSSS